MLKWTPCRYVNEVCLFVMYSSVPSLLLDVVTKWALWVESCKSVLNMIRPFISNHGTDVCMFDLVLIIWCEGERKLVEDCGR